MEGREERIAEMQDMWDSLHDPDRIEQSKRLIERKARAETKKADTGIC
jgi:hypothetical protein